MSMCCSAVVFSFSIQDAHAQFYNKTVSVFSCPFSFVSCLANKRFLYCHVQKERSALHYAMTLAQEADARQLIENKADINAKDKVSCVMLVLMRFAVLCSA